MCFAFLVLDVYVDRGPKSLAWGGTVPVLSLRSHRILMGAQIIFLRSYVFCALFIYFMGVNARWCPV